MMGRSAAAEVVDKLPAPNPKDVADQCLEELEKKYGEISTELLLKEASSPEHPLHGRFEWDDSVAAHKWRLEQAAQIIRASKFISFMKDGETPPVRRWISFPSDEGRYVSRPKAMKLVDVRMAFIGNKVSVLQSWCNETVDVPELAYLRKAILIGLKKFSS